uniref:Uncharacterized protein n=1 Tax=Tanacetum cinerariifolium TaxID=118510 RepID=A0A6L2L2V7_TANCI|nr:hypothetical protein [Tanacetum cinerariifolium]
MKEGVSVADHVNEFNSNLSRLISVDIKFNDEVQALLLLSSFPKNWPGTITTISSSIGTTKLKFDNIRDIILVEDTPRKTSGEYSNSLLSTKDKGKAQSKTKGKSRTKVDRNQRREDKEVNMIVRDYDDALVCCVENTIKDCIMDDGAYLMRKVTRGSLVAALGNKRESLYMIKVPSDEINIAINGRGNAALWHQRLGHMRKKGMKILALKGMIPDLQKAVVGFCKPCVLGKEKKGKKEWQGKEVSLAHLKVFRRDSYVKVKDVARDKLDEKSTKCTFIGYGSKEMGCHFWDSKCHKVVQSRDATINEDSLYGAKATIDFDESSDTSEGSENNGRFKDSERSEEEDSDDGAFFEEGGSETP